MFVIDDIVKATVKVVADTVKDCVDSTNRRKIKESNNDAIVKGLGMTLAAGVLTYGIKKFSEGGANKNHLPSGK